jgi:NAD(P) transhydrogenase
MLFSNFKTPFNDPEFNRESYKKSNLLFGSSSGMMSVDAPLTLWTLPEVASVGYSDSNGNGDGNGDEDNHRVVTGVANFKDCARGRLSGDNDGFLKIVGKYDSSIGAHRIIGVHIIGEGANELIQLGSVLVHSGATLETVANTPFSAVTLSGLYQTACETALYTLAAS